MQHKQCTGEHAQWHDNDTTRDIF